MPAVIFYSRVPIRQIRLVPRCTVYHIIRPYVRLLYSAPLQPSRISTPKQIELSPHHSTWVTVNRFSLQRSTTAKKESSTRKLSLAPPMKTEFSEKDPAEIKAQPIFRIDYMDDTYYYGQVKGTKRHGLGALYSQNAQLIYIGEWKDDAYHGIGVFEKNGVKYEGEFAHGSFHGRGVETEGNTRFIGFYKNG